MKPQNLLLYSQDPEFDQVLAIALAGTRATVMVARSVSEALQIACSRSRRLDVAVMDFNQGCRGMTLLSAIHVCREELPVVVLTATNCEHANAIAYANGASICLTKPLSSTTLADALEKLAAPFERLAAA